MVNNHQGGLRRSVLATGARGGLGSASVQRFLDGGWRVAAADLHIPDDRGHPEMLGVTMDVTDDGSVAEAVRRIEDWCPEGLDAVVTFAGIGGIGPLMETTPGALERVLDVNVVGTHRAVLACWPLVRRAGGRVILIGSETGWQPALPLNGPYAMSKHALEAHADALRRELMFVGTPVVLMQPGPFRAQMTERITEVFDAVPAQSPFKPLTDLAGRRVAHENAAASDPSVLAEAVFAAAMSGHPRARYRVGTHRGRALLERLPVGVVDRLLRLMFTSG